MREIKFRAWDGKCYTTDFFITSEGTVFRSHYDSKAEMVSGFIIEQFTGLHDKNGKEIYEGDIIKNCAGNSNKIIWHDGAFIIGEPDEIGHYYILLGECSVDQFEVIGNIHEKQS